MQTPNLFTSNLARFHKFRYDMAIDHFDRREDSAAKQIFIELTQDAFTPVIWKAFSYYMLAIFSPISMANINLDHARRIGRLLQDEETRVAFLRDVELRQAKLDAAASTQEVERIIDPAVPPS